MKGYLMGGLFICGQLQVFPIGEVAGVILNISVEE